LRTSLVGIFALQPRQAAQEGHKTAEADEVGGVAPAQPGAILNFLAFVATIEADVGYRENAHCSGPPFKYGPWQRQPQRGLCRHPLLNLQQPQRGQQQWVCRGWPKIRIAAKKPMLKKQTAWKKYRVCSSMIHLLVVAFFLFFPPLVTAAEAGAARIVQVVVEDSDQEYAQ
jgi:hypothetical protein